ncbi:unnamed protein product, partial [Owenia fusiformis]
MAPILEVYMKHRKMRSEIISDRADHEDIPQVEPQSVDDSLLKESDEGNVKIKIETPSDNINIDHNEESDSHFPIENTDLGGKKKQTVELSVHQIFSNDNDDDNNENMEAESLDGECIQKKDFVRTERRMRQNVNLFNRNRHKCLKFINSGHSIPFHKLSQLGYAFSKLTPTKQNIEIDSYSKIPKMAPILEVYMKRRQMRSEDISDKADHEDIPQVESQSVDDILVGESDKGNVKIKMETTIDNGDNININAEQIASLNCDYEDHSNSNTECVVPLMDIIVKPKEAYGECSERTQRKIDVNLTKIYYDVKHQCLEYINKYGSISNTKLKRLKYRFSQLTRVKQNSEIKK